MREKVLEGQVVIVTRAASPRGLGRAMTEALVRAGARVSMMDINQQRPDESQETRFGHVFAFAISTGMRRSEICGLKWDAVDLESGRLEVKATLQRLKGRGLETGTPKTDRSRRNMALAPETVELLRDVQGAQILAKMEAGPLWQEQGYVFTHPNGTPLIPDQITQEFAAVIMRFDLPHLTFHGLRHAFATMGLQAGINPKVVSEALGHSSVAITLDLYSHVLPNMQDELASAVANLLKREPQTD